jgi:uncharacterized protein (TIGR03118 family)
LIFDTIDGTISGWNPEVDATHAIVLRDAFADGNPAVYTGLEIAQNSQGHNVLYAADVLNNRIARFDGSFNALPSFTDPTVTGVSAWQVEAINGKLYVTFANPFAPISAPHGGVVDVFDTDGNLLTPNHFAANAPGAGPLQNPWGIVQAPENFGAYSGDLLIGNVAGAGNINVFDPTTGAYLGQLLQPNGAPIAITGLWDLEFGQGTPDSGKTNQLFFDAGPNAPGVSINGLFGVIRPAGAQGRNGSSVGPEAFALPVFGSGSIHAGAESFTISALSTSPDPTVSHSTDAMLLPPAAPAPDRPVSQRGSQPRSLVAIGSAFGLLLDLDQGEAALVDLN